MQHYEVWTDGSCCKVKDTDSKGDCGAGYVVVDADTNKIIHLHGEYIGISTNNMAEFVAVQLAIEDILTRERDGATIYMDLFSDSKIVIESLKGNYNLKEPHLIKMVKTIRNLVSKMKGACTFTWVKAHSGVELNEFADFLAYSAARG